MSKTKQSSKEFHAVDFMRQVREEMSNLYNADKELYFEQIQLAMENFKASRKTKVLVDTAPTR